MAKIIKQAASEDASEHEDNTVTKAALIDQAQWDQAGGVEYGGSSEILKLDVGQMAGPLTYVGSSEITTDLGETTGHTAEVAGEIVRLPIAASFLRCLDQAGISRGDKFLIRREENKIKAKGAGKGQEMAIYAVKVIEKAAKSE